MASVLTFTGKAPSFYRLSAAEQKQAACLLAPKKMMSRYPLPREHEESCPSSAGMPLALPRNHYVAAQGILPAPGLLHFSLLQPLTLKARLWKILVELNSALPSATSNPGQSRHARSGGQYIMYNCWSVTIEDEASGSYGHSPMKCKFNVTICNVKCFAL